jgi:starvation-inducible DNA-binding protein
MSIEIGISDADRQSVCMELAKVLSDEMVLYIKTKNAHWNIEGSDFYDKHVFFETQMVMLDDMIDQVAERIRMLGHYAPGSLTAYLHLTHLSEANREMNDSHGFIRELLENHESIIMLLRGYSETFATVYHDAGSCDFVIGVMEKHEKMAWFLRSHIRQ